MACSSSVPLLVPFHRSKPRRSCRWVLLAAATLSIALLLALPQGGSSTFVNGSVARVAKAGDAPARFPAAPLNADPNRWGLVFPLEANTKNPWKKPPFVAPALLNKITRMNKEGIKETIQIWNRQNTLIPAMVGHTFAVHNGRDFVPVTVSEGMVGFKIADFVPTHTFKTHPKQAKATKYTRKSNFKPS